MQSMWPSVSNLWCSLYPWCASVNISVVLSWPYVMGRKHHTSDVAQGCKFCPQHMDKGHQFTPLFCFVNKHKYIFEYMYRYVPIKLLKVFIEEWGKGTKLREKDWVHFYTRCVASATFMAPEPTMRLEQQNLCEENVLVWLVGGMLKILKIFNSSSWNLTHVKVCIGSSMFPTQKKKSSQVCVCECAGVCTIVY